MKDIKTYITEGAKHFTLGEWERDALASFMGVLCGSFGDDEEVQHAQEQIKLSDDELKQVSDLFDVLDNTETYKKINRNNIIDDIPLIKKIYDEIKDTDILDDNWDLIDAFEKILNK